MCVNLFINCEKLRHIRSIYQRYTYTGDTKPNTRENLFLTSFVISICDIVRHFYLLTFMKGKLFVPSHIF